MMIYVGNFPKTVTEEEVRNIFEKYGEVTDARLIKKEYSEELRGFGFIEMPLDSDARTAIQKINGTELEGRTLTVNEVRHRETQPGNNQKNGGYRSSRY